MSPFFLSAVSDDEPLSQIPKPKKRCKNVLRSPEDSSPTDVTRLQRKKTKQIRKAVREISFIKPVGKKGIHLLAEPRMGLNMDRSVKTGEGEGAGSRGWRWVQLGDCITDKYIRCTDIYGTYEILLVYL